MNDPLVSTVKVIAIALWSIAGIFMTAGWAVVLGHSRDWQVALMLASTALGIIGVAMLLHVRCYVLRLICLIRLMNGLSGDLESRELHSLP